MSERRFRAVAEKIGAGVRLPIPFDPNEVWGRRERHHVAGAVGSCPFRGEVKVDDADWFLTLGPAWVREYPGELDGDVDVRLAPEGPQVETMPEDIASALAAAPEARVFFESLPTFYRKNFMRWIESAKRPETRSKRIAETVMLLREGKRER